MTEENQTVETTETCNTQRKCCLCHKIFGLKGLAIIYKVLSILTIVVMLVVLGFGWVEVIRTKMPILDALWWSANVALSFLLYALLFITVSRVLKVLRKIKHAVNNK